MMLGEKEENPVIDRMIGRFSDTARTCTAAVPGRQSVRNQDGIAELNGLIDPMRRKTQWIDPIRDTNRNELQNNRDSGGSRCHRLRVTQPG